MTAGARGGWGGCGRRGYAAAVATRTPTRPRPSSRSSGRPPARRPARRRPAQRARRGPGLPVGLARALARIVEGLWLVLAHAVGASVRHVGGGARDLDPAHRRDGLGLAALAGALVVAVGAWAGDGGPAGHALTAVVRTLVGSAVDVLPPVLVAAAWRLLRRPASDGPAGRVAIGWIAIGAGTLGVL